ncbi:MAG TPA: hypothetical protein VI172_13725 [Candidatus Dormibacteraeota bacterium]|jgi:hypothetical protein
MTRILVVSLLVLGALACFVFAWLSNARHTRELDRLGVVYGCKRWPQEDNRSHYCRLRARIGNHWRIT